MYNLLKLFKGYEICLVSSVLKIDGCVCFHNGIWVHFYNGNFYHKFMKFHMEMQKVHGFVEIELFPHETLEKKVMLSKFSISNMVELQNICNTTL